MLIELLGSVPTISGGADPMGFFGVTLVVIIMICSLVWHYGRAREILEKWVRENGFELIESEYRHFFCGPYFWRTSKGQAVYYVRVRDSDGRIRSGWVRCGGWWAGLLSDHVDVRWEK